MSTVLRAAFLVSFIALSLSPGASRSAGAASLIRDAEVENTIRAFATPLFRAAGLKASDVKIYIVKDNTLNAFVAGGQNLFVHTGLILASDSANQVIGVIAHETGHIAGGHLSRIHDALSKNSVAGILAMVLGGAAAVATGRGDVGAAVMAGGQGVAMRNLLAYTRVQESSADHAAMRFLDATHTSAKGLLQFMEKLGDQELLSPAQQDPYVRTHPLTRERIDALTHFIEKSPNSNTPSPPNVEDMLARIKAKLYAFLNPMGRTLRVYKESDNSVPSRYARAVGRYREAKLDDALVLLDSLIADEPDNPYFHELRGQATFESARLADALASYGKAATLLPDNGLIRRELARVQLEFNQPQLTDAAIINLEAALATEGVQPFTWRLLAIAHGRNGDQGRSSIALAEEALLQEKPDVAAYHAGRALGLFKEGSREWIQAEDIRLAAKEMESRKRREKGQ